MSYEYVNVKLAVQALKNLTKLQFDTNNNLKINIASSEILVPTDIQGDTVGLAKDETIERTQDTFTYDYPSGAGSGYITTTRPIPIVKPGYSEVWPETYTLNKTVTSTDYTDVKAIVFRPWYINVHHLYIRMWVTVKFDTDATVYIRVFRGNDIIWEFSSAGTQGESKTFFQTVRIDWKDDYVQDIKLQAKVSASGEQVTIEKWIVHFGPDKPFIPIYDTIGTPGSPPPSKGLVLLGYDADNNAVRRVRVTQDGKVAAWLG